MRLYKLFAEYVITTFLTDDKKGEFAALVIDEQFIESAAAEFNMTPEKLIELLRYDFRYYWGTLDFYFALAVISLQLYAASICETDIEYSAQAYNPRLCKILNCGVSDLQSWYKNNQELIWSQFYKWCRNNKFQVQECLRRDYRGKYIQYPLELAKYILNREDLKYIASIFKKHRLGPNENIFYSDFWKILDVRICFRRLNNHIQKVFEAVYEDTNCYDIVKSQIYNHYVNWNGEYIDSAEQQTQKIKLKNHHNLHLSDKDGIYRIDIRKDDDSKVDSFQIDSKLIYELKSYYSFKREGVIIFQRCSSGDLNYWDETRFIEDKDSIGVAIVFSNTQRVKFYGSRVLFKIQDIFVYEFEYNNILSQFYSDGERAYTLFGGLRVARNTYLTGGDPVWRVHKDCDYLVNGKSYSITKGDHILDLEEGEYIIKFPKSCDVKITIISPRKKNIEWADKQTKWELDRIHYLWRPTIIDTGIIGLDFGDYTKTGNPESKLKTWVKIHNDRNLEPINNIALKVLNNINKYE